MYFQKGTSKFYDKDNGNNRMIDYYNYLYFYVYLEQNCRFYVVNGNYLGILKLDDFADINSASAQFLSHNYGLKNAELFSWDQIIANVFTNYKNMVSMNESGLFSNVVHNGYNIFSNTSNFDMNKIKNTTRGL